MYGIFTYIWFDFDGKLVGTYTSSGPHSWDAHKKIDPWLFRVTLPSYLVFIEKIP